MNRIIREIGIKESFSFFISFAIGLFCLASVIINQSCSDTQTEMIIIQKTWVRHAEGQYSSPTAWIRSTEGELYYIRNELYSPYYKSCFSLADAKLEIKVDTHRIYRDRDSGEITNKQIVEAKFNGIKLFGIEDENHIRAQNRIIALILGIFFMLPIICLVLLGLFILLMISPLSKLFVKKNGQ